MSSATQFLKAEKKNTHTQIKAETINEHLADRKTTHLFDIKRHNNLLRHLSNIPQEKYISCKKKTKTTLKDGAGFV